MKLWWRHLFFDVGKLFLALLFLIFALYVTIDYSVHSKLYSQAELSLRAISRYYAAEFSYRAPFLIPLALLLATLKAILGLNFRRELLALQAGGVSTLQLITPHLVVALLATFALFVNYQIAFPKAHEIIERMHHSVMEGKNEAASTLRALRLEDGSKLIYQRYEPSKRRLFDAYWIQADGTIYRCKYLFPHGKSPFGRYVDELVRTESGLLQVKDSYAELTLPLRFAIGGDLAAALSPPEALSLSALYRQRPKARAQWVDRDAELVAHFHAKLALPWLSLLVVLGVAPFCVRFSRQMPVFVIYGLAILGFLSLQTVLDVTLILAKSHVMAPAFGLWIPLGLGFGISSVRLATLN